MTTEEALGHLRETIHACELALKDGKRARLTPEPKDIEVFKHIEGVLEEMVQSGRDLKVGDGDR